MLTLTNSLVPHLPSWLQTPPHCKPSHRAANPKSFRVLARGKAFSPVKNRVPTVQYIAIIDCQFVPTQSKFATSHQYITPKLYINKYGINRNVECRTSALTPIVKLPTMPPHMPIQCTEPNKPTKNADNNVNSLPIHLPHKIMNNSKIKNGSWYNNRIHK